MAFLKYAKSTVVHPLFSSEKWGELRGRAVSPESSFGSRKAAQVVLDQYDPKQYLLTHCTIVASVDTEDAGQPTGIQMVDGVQINRKFSDYHITPATSKLVNNNHDAFERKLLLSSFRTFVGSANYVEHVQIPELSKGRIIDAAARDIGESIYIDILVATERKHKALIDAITSGQLGTLSMGCQVSYTQCTKCGNVSEDESQLCRHIKYEKGNQFIDSKGQRRKVAELCGHFTEPASVKFIEASWVANPAFKGAVLRNILSPSEAQGLTQKVQVAFQKPSEVPDASALKKVARQAIPGDHLAYLHSGPSIGQLKAPAANSALSRAENNRRERLAQQTFDDGMSKSQQPGEGDAGKVDPLKKPVDDLYEALVDKVKDRVREDLDGGAQSRPNENKSNESLIKSALQYSEWRERAKVVLANVRAPSTARSVLAGLILHSMGGWEAVNKARRFTGSEILVMDRLMSRFMKRASMAGEARVYRAVIAVGGIAKYPNVNSYLTACSKVMGKSITESERALLVEKGKLFSMGL